jgi:hypothetical protein
MTIPNPDNIPPASSTMALNSTGKHGGGEDTVHLWITGLTKAWPLVYDRLLLAKQRVQMGGDQVEEFGGRLWIMRTSGMGKGAGHCPFSLQGDGVVVGFRENAMKLEFHSTHLTEFGGLVGAWSAIQPWIDSVFDIDAVKLTRVDLCVDLVGIPVDHFVHRQISGAYVCRAKRRSNYAGVANVGLAYETHSVGNSLSGSTISQIDADATGFVLGRNLRLRIYDKVLECKHDNHKTNVMVKARWGCRPTTATRVEFQVRSDILRTFELDGHAINDLYVYFEHRGALWRYLTREWFVMLEKKGTGKNHRKGKIRTDEKWRIVQEVGDRVYGASPEVTLNRVDTGVPDVDDLIRQALGCLLSAMTWTNYGRIDRAGVVEFLAERLDGYSDQQIDDALRKHRERVHMKRASLESGDLGKTG